MVGPVCSTAFVVCGNVVVGLIVFAILITILFVVIANGAQRG
jgi:flagellar biosynthesis component FlhA